MKKRTKIMQNHVMPKSCKNHVHAMQKTCKTVRTAFFQRKTVQKAIIPGHTCRWRVRGQKNWPRKKRMASWARQQQQITEAADGGARARTGADGAVVLNLRRGPGAYALLSRADGQLTRGASTTSPTWACSLARTSTTTSPSSREGPNDYILLQATSGGLAGTRYRNSRTEVETLLRLYLDHALELLFVKLCWGL